MDVAIVHNGEVKRHPPPTLEAHMVSGHVHSSSTLAHNSQQEQRSESAESCSMSDPSIAVSEAFKQFSQVTVSAVGPASTLPALSSSFSTSTLFLFFSFFSNFSFALTSMALVQDSLRPRTICASCDMNATIRLEILTLPKNNLGPGSQK